MERLHSDIQELLNEIHGLRRDVTRSRVTARLLAAALGATLVLAVAVGLVAVQARSALICVSSWARATTERTVALTSLSAERQDALDVLLRDVFSTDKNVITKDYTAYISVSNLYRDAVRNNPPQALPSFHCGITLISEGGKAP